MLPLLHADMLLVPHVHEYLHHSFLFPIGEFHGSFVCVEDPTQYLFALVPATIAFVHLFFDTASFLFCVSLSGFANTWSIACIMYLLVSWWSVCRPWDSRPMKSPMYMSMCATGFVVLDKK